MYQNTATTLIYAVWYMDIWEISKSGVTFCLNDEKSLKKGYYILLYNIQLENMTVIIVIERE